MRIEPFGQSAVLISFEKEINLNVHNQVLQLYNKCKSKDLYTFFIPAYNSLTLGIDLNKISLSDAIQKTGQFAEDEDISHPLTSFRRLTIPVCYENSFATDMQEIQNTTQMEVNEIIRIHSSQYYRVFMLGFVAGFAYMGKLSESLKVSRKSSPEKYVPAGAVGIAGLQTGIYPIDAPGGWQIIGSTPIKTFNPTEETPHLLSPGDEVSFRPISEDEFKLIEIKQETGIYEPEFKYDA